MKTFNLMTYTLNIQITNEGYQLAEICAQKGGLIFRPDMGEINTKYYFEPTIFTKAFLSFLTVFRIRIRNPEYGSRGLKKD